MKKEKILLLAILTAFVCINAALLLTGSTRVYSDCNLYLYMAREMAGGAVPYRDFYFAHPPFMLLPAAFLIKLFGNPFLAGFLQTVSAGIIIIGITYLIAEKIRKGSGIFAAALLFSSTYFQLGSRCMSGISLNLALILLAFYLFIEREDKGAGFFTALSLLARYSSFPLAVALSAYSLLKGRKKFFFGILAALPIFLILSIIPNFLNDTILYHLARRGGPFGMGLAGLRDFFYKEYLIVILGLVPLLLYKSFRKRPLVLKLSLLSIASAALVLVVFHSDVRPWYLSFTLPFFAVLGGFFLRSLFDADIKKVPQILKKAGIIAAVLIIVMLNLRPVIGEFQVEEQDFFLEVYERMPPGNIFDTSQSVAAHYALVNGADVAGEIDAYPNRFISGQIDVQELIEKLETGDTKYIIDSRKGKKGDHLPPDHYWRQTGLKDYIYSNFCPYLLIDYTTPDPPYYHWLIRVWKPAEFTGDFALEGSEAVYLSSFLVSYGPSGSIYAEEYRNSRESDIKIPQSFADYLTSRNILGRQPIASNAWNQDTINGTSHWIVQDGQLKSETWVCTGDAVQIYTETTEGDETISLLKALYSPSLGTWTSMEIYGNINGDFVLIYEENLIS